MTRFPLRLGRDLGKVLLAQKLFGAARRPLVARLELPAEEEPARNSAPTSRELPDAAALLASTNAPVVWLSGPATDDPRIGPTARQLAARGRTVFLELDGPALRRRIHEFRPVARLFLVLPLYGPEGSHDGRTGTRGHFRATLESLRTARLSGFHACVETCVFADTEMEELRELAGFIAALGTDGWLVRRADGASRADVPLERVSAARQLIPSGRWRTFCELLENSLDRTAPLPCIAATSSVRAPREIARRGEGLGTL